MPDIFSCRPARVASAAATFAFAVRTTAEFAADGGSWVVCPPHIECAGRVQREDPQGWRLRAGFDKTLSQRSYELLVLYEYPGADRQQARHAEAVAEAMRQLICAATVARCQPSLLERAIGAARRWTRNIGAEAAELANAAFRACGAANMLLMDCLKAATAWAEAEYIWAVGPFLEATGVQADADLMRRNSWKVPSTSGYPALLYAPDISPQGVCGLGGEARHAEWPLFGGEAFGDSTWADVTNQRTRHLGMFSLFELMENGATFKSRHPGGLSGIVVNFGAGDGICRSGHAVDPANCMIATGASGVLFEANPKLEPLLQDNLGHRQPEIVIMSEAAEAATVSRRLATALSRRPGPPLHHREIDLIKIDVDGADCDLVSALSEAGWRPKVWHVEINPLFPPGVVVRPRNVAAAGASSLGSAFTHRKAGEDGADHGKESSAHEFFIGCSLQALLDAAGPEYTLLQVEYENAVLVRSDLADAFRPWLSAYSDEEKWRIGYFCNPLARVRQPHDMDEESWFLRYDFRQWGDPSLSARHLASEVEMFLQHFSVLESYDVRLPVAPATYSSAALGQADQESTASPGLKDSLDDPNCEKAWKGRVLEWKSILSNLERLLKVWAGGGDAHHDLAGLLMALTEQIAEQLNIDHAWPIFKSLSRGECPLGGLSVAVVLRWHCSSPGRERFGDFARASNHLFDSMKYQLPMNTERTLQKTDLGTSAPLGCEPMLERYLEAALHRIDFSAALRSRWPVFELLSALHTESRSWPRGYP